jgi:SAM-dependent methyltransferase
MLDLLLPWRWKRRIHRLIDAKFNSTRDTLITALNDARAQLEERLDQRLAEQRNELIELGDAVLNGFKEVRAHTDVRLHEQTTYMEQEQRAQLSELGDAIIGGLKEVQAHNDLRLHEQTTFLGQEQRAELSKIQAQLAEARDATAEDIYELRQTLTAEYDDTSLHRLRSAAGDVRRGLAALKNEVAAQLGFSLHDMATQVADQRLWLEKISADLAAHKEWLEKISVETTSRLTHLDTSLHTRLNTLEYVEFPGIGEQIHEIAAQQMRFVAKQGNQSAWQAHPKERYAPAKPEPFDMCLKRAEQEFPKVFSMWKERLDTLSTAFDESKYGNAACARDLYSRIFNDFVQLHASGRVLDIGCGVFGRPYYLDSYPAHLISGLEPLPMREAADFELIRGLGEYLPWPDDSFSTIISATSLDHCLSLQHSLDEMVRVLRPGGRVLLWIGSNPGAPKFEPEDPEFSPSDKFHLFHFDKAWFEPMLEARFDLEDRLELKRPGFSHILYSLRLKEDQQSARGRALTLHAAVGRF